VISPEGCAAILWGDRSRAPQAAEALRLTAPDLKELDVIDDVVAEPIGGAHRDPEGTARTLGGILAGHLDRLSTLDRETLLRTRMEKFRRMGAFETVDKGR